MPTPEPRWGSRSGAGASTRCASSRAARTILAAALVTGAAACSSGGPRPLLVRAQGPPEVERVLRAFPAHELWIGDSGGTGVHLGHDRILTCRHLLVDGAEPLAAADLPASITIDERITTTFDIEAAGRTDAWADDWCILQVHGAGLETPSALDWIAREPRIPNGEVLWSIACAPAWLCTRLEKSRPPLGWAPEPGVEIVRLGFGPVPHGCSGGPAVSLSGSDMVWRGIVAGSECRVSLGWEAWRMIVLPPPVDASGRVIRPAWRPAS